MERWRLVQAAIDGARGPPGGAGWPVPVTGKAFWRRGLSRMCEPSWKRAVRFDLAEFRPSEQNDRLMGPDRTASNPRRWFSEP